MHDFSLYVHIPYCRAKCPYCDFNSHAATRWPEAEYTDALVVELEHYAAQSAWQGAINTIFFGGGTPSLFEPQSIARVLAAARRLWPARAGGNPSSVPSRVDPAGRAGAKAGAFRDLGPEDEIASRPPSARVGIEEITLEANPGTVTLASLRGLRAAGVNRISFGVQSFNPRQLARLGRIHDANEAVAAIALARAAGFDNVSLDLIFALPDQTLAEWEADLRAAVTLLPDHISAYNLTYESGTAFFAQRAQGQLRPAPEEVEAAMFTRTQELLDAAGYSHYEISNFARRGRECRHNLNYWRGGAYLGIGAGAHSFAHAPAPGKRWSNENDPTLFLQRVAASGHARVFEEDLSQSQACGEFVFLGLRLRAGFDAAAFEERFGLEFLAAFPHAARLQRDGLLARAGSCWQLTDRGLMVADSVFATFM